MAYYAITNPTYQPAMRGILSMTQAVKTVITTTYDGTTPADHQYETGLIVRLRIPEGFGMTLADEFQGAVTKIDSTSFSLNLDTTEFEAFAIPPLNPGQFGTPAVVVPIGEANEILSQATRNVLPYP